MLLIFALLAAVAPAPLADWNAADHIEVRTRSADAAAAYAAVVDIAANGDARIVSDGGTILFVSGRWMVTKDVVTVPGAEVDAMDIAGLQVQTVLALLARAYPNGPGQLEESDVVAVEEKTAPIEVATSSASGSYAAPWTLRGTVKRESAARIAFELTLTSRGQPPMTFTGIVEAREPRFTLASDFPLEGWRVHSLGPSMEHTAGGSTLDYGARPQSRGYRTVGELRAQTLMRIQ